MKAHDVLAAVEQLQPGATATKAEQKTAIDARAEVIRMLRGPVAELYKPRQRRGWDCLTLVSMGLHKKGKNREAEWLAQLSDCADLVEERRNE